MKIIKTAKYIEARFGQFKFKCEECGEFTQLSKKDRGSRSIPRCNFCGSSHLDPVTEYAHTNIQEGVDRGTQDFHSQRKKMNFKKRYNHELV